MNAVLFHTEEFGPIETDSFGNPDLRSLFLTFQKAATDHAETLSIGRNFYEPNGLLYVLSRLKVRFYKNFEGKRKYVLKTFALPPEKIRFYRDAIVTDDRGETICAISSLWVLIGKTTRRLCLTDRLVEALRPLLPEMKTLRPALGEQLQAIEERDDAEYLFDHVVAAADIDGNGHMNNTVYFALLQKAGFTGALSCLEIDFERECFAGERLSIYKDKCGYACGRKEGALSFKAFVTYR